jgi:hypothetical protein
MTLSHVVLSCDGKRPQPIEFEAIFDYHGNKNLRKMKSLGAVADTSSMSLAYLPDIFPGIQILRLDHSIIPNIRDLCTGLTTLRILSLEHCGLTSLNGISAVSPTIQELHVGFNQIADVSELLGLNSLKVLNVESNLIASVEDIGLLNCCRKLRALVLRGNGAADDSDYRTEVKRMIPRLRVLDEVRFGEEDQEEAANDPPPAAPPAAPPPPEDQPKSAPIARRPLQPLPPPAGRETREGARPTTAMRQALGQSRGAPKPVVTKPKLWYNTGSIRL